VWQYKDASASYDYGAGSPSVHKVQQSMCNLSDHEAVKVIRRRHLYDLSVDQLVAVVPIRNLEEIVGRGPWLRSHDSYL
jgi:hypothetical protein